MVWRQAPFVVVRVLALCCCCCLELGAAQSDNTVPDSDERFAAVSPETRAVATSASTAAAPIFPSERCAAREEWQTQCSWWTGDPHNRHLKYDRQPQKGDGIGANLLRVAWALDRAMLFDLEVEFVGPFLATHGTGDFGQWFGLTENPLLAVRDPEAYQHAQTQEVPFPEGYGFEWFYSQRNRTSVVYTFDSAKLNRMKTWARPVSPPPASPGVCRYVRQILRDIFWSRPGERDRCRSLFATSPELLDFFAARDGEAAAMGREHGHGANEDPNIDVSVRGQEPDPLENTQLRRPWVVAVHVRRGDILTFKGGFWRLIPHAYFVATVTSALQAIARIYQDGNDNLNTASTPRVAILVFSEGSPKMGKFQVLDEHGDAVEWKAPRDTCQDLGLECYQEIFLRESATSTFDCLAAADIVIGSISSYSEAAAAVSTNVKIMLAEGEEEQDRVTLNATKIGSKGRLDVEEQAEVNKAVEDWWHCSREAKASRNRWDSSGGDHGRRGAVGAGDNFYQTTTTGTST